MARFIQQSVDHGALAALGLSGIAASVLLTLGFSLLTALPDSLSGGAGSTAALPDIARNLLASLRIGG